MKSTCALSLKRLFDKHQCCARYRWQHIPAETGLCRCGSTPGHPETYCGLRLQVSLIARHTSNDPEKIAKDIQRPKYFDPWQAKEYGIIDRVSPPFRVTHV